MLYLFINQLGWLAFTALLIVVVVLYARINQQLRQLRQDITRLQTKIGQHSKDVTTTKLTSPADTNPTEASNSELESVPSPHTTSSNWPPKLNPLPSKDAKATSVTASNPVVDTFQNLRAKSPLLNSTGTIDPDERSLPMVTSLIHSLKNWFFGGNLVVRVGVLVLLVGVVLLLRLLSDYIEIPVAIKLITIGVIGLGLAALGLKLAKNRFAYGITLQGAGLAIAYLATFFAYSVYQVLASVPSFIGIGLLSALTVVLAVRQNAFPLALLALSGGFFAPILTSQDSSSLTVLFSYYLLLNVTIAVIAHYRPWKVLNIFGAGVTFGLAYYWGMTENLNDIITHQRWSLVTLVALHLILYLFVVIRYAQQIIAYNDDNEAIMNATNVKERRSNYVFPIDIGLLFSVPILSFGLFATLLDGIPNALTITSAILAVIYLGLGWRFIQRSQRYALITEGMLALGFGFLALVIPLALNAEWIAFGWSVQGLALVWFGRRSLRAWSVLFGVLLQLVSITMLLNNFVVNIEQYPTLALTISAISAIASAFILRASNSPAVETQGLATSTGNIENQRFENHTLSEYAKVLGISEVAAQQWLTSINSQSMAFKLIWQRPALIRLLTFAAIGWLLYVLVIDFDQWFASWRLATTALI